MYTPETEKSGLLIGQNTCEKKNQPECEIGVFRTFSQTSSKNCCHSNSKESLMPSRVSSQNYIPANIRENNYILLLIKEESYCKSALMSMGRGKENSF